MRRWVSLAFACVVVGACARAVGPDEVDGSVDANASDVALDNSGCPQYDLSKDPKHCGSCTNACTAGLVCTNGMCKSMCTSPQVMCASDAGPICANTGNDPQHCGGCTSVCTLADAGGMTPGTNNPDPGIFDAGYDGGLGWTLGATACASATCGIDCPDAMALCSDQICYDLENHHDHCGSCGAGCMAGTEWCGLGHCCAVGSQWCGSSCANVSSDLNNCGKCGNACDGGGCNNGVCAACSPTTITGPTLTSNIGGWPKAGLRIKALKNTTLTSFVVNNQGAADTVSLTNTSGTVISSVSVPASSTAYTANVSWALTAGTSYDLILVSMSNGKFVSYTSYPTTGTGIEVDAVVDTSQTTYTSWWFTFTSITSCP